MIKKVIDKIKRKYLAYTNPQKLAKILFKRILKRDLNLNDPKSFNEKINWLKFNSDTTLWTQLADKYLVSVFIKEQGLEDFLIKSYGKWDNVDDINFNELPESFVIKSNNGCKTVLLVKNKKDIDEKAVRKTLKKWLKIKFGYDSAEPHYLNIKPCIIAEEYLQESNSISSTLIDYKFICIHGEPTFIKVYANRNKTSYDLNIYDPSWVSQRQFVNNEIFPNEVHIPRPKTLDTMLHICSVLSKDFPQVRIDLYEVSGKTYFGEMTFTSFGGYDPDFTLELDLKLGDLLNINHN
tara:strand:+ start:4165 stop:5046 length:882 start_codon:yes stop_codon:yes gene_type:complete